jgi:hypothetical protein
MQRNKRISTVGKIFIKIGSLDSAQATYAEVENNQSGLTRLGQVDRFEPIHSLATNGEFRLVV